MTWRHLLTVAGSRGSRTICVDGPSNSDRGWRRRRFLQSDLGSLTLLSLSRIPFIKPHKAG